MTDADAGRGGDFLRWWHGWEANGKFTAGNVDAVVAAGDRHGDGEAPGTSAELFEAACGRAGVTHRRQSRHWLEGANQDAAGRAVWLRHQIEALVHAVDQVDVGVTRRTKKDLRSRRQAAGGVCGKIGSAEICLHFDNAPGADARGRFVA